MMDPTIQEPPPGCLVILAPLSASMGEDVRVWLAHRYFSASAEEEGAEPPAPEPEIRDLPKSVAVRFLVDELIDGLVNTLAAGYPLPLDVAVLGYRTDNDGKLKLVSLLPGGNADVRFVPLANLATVEVEPRGREGDPRKWTAVVECAGNANATAALAEAHKLVSVWLTGRYTARPPVVLHVTDCTGLDESYGRVARSLGLLVTGYGPTRLLHIGFTPEAEPTLCGLWGETVPAPWAGLMELSAELPAELEGRPARKAVSVNDWSLTDAWSALFDMTWTEDTVAWGEVREECFEAAIARGMWTQKMGNTPEQWEDAYATEPRGVAAVADGASTGIYCRIWADRLARSFITERPEVRDPVALGKWVHGLRGEWRAAIDYDKLNWSKKAKVDDVGAAATLLGLEVGPAEADGHHPWRAFAIGDASLFWIREGRLLGTFPVVAADQFGSAPLLVRSNPGYKTLSLAAAGVCQPGDQFLLATDAVAARLFRSAANGPGPDWERFETIDEAEWREELDVLRKSNDMVNDDCTLVTLRVRRPGFGSQVAEVEDQLQETEVGVQDEEADIRDAEEVGELLTTPTADVELSTAEPTPDPEPTPESGLPIPDEDDQRKPARDGFSDSTDNPV